MRNWEEITNKIKEILEQQEVPLPDFEIISDIGRSRLILYYNKYVTDENRQIFIDYINE